MKKHQRTGMLKISFILAMVLAVMLSVNAQTTATSTTNFLSSSKDSISVDKKELKTQSNDLKESKHSVNQPDKDSVYLFVPKMPQFPGGEKELSGYISTNLLYPLEAQQKGIQGTVFIRFVVNKFGKVEKAQVIRTLEPSMDQVALRVINSLPEWIPGEIEGKKVAVYYTLPVTFKIESGSKSTVYKEHSTSGIKESFKFTDGTKPIYFIDGASATDVEVKALKPENIKEINVLKNASATAIYGTRGVNGVVVITLKK